MHKRLDVWQVSIEFVTDIYQLVRQFPHEEKYGLSDQLRRASVSIPSNIAEGAARQSNKEFLQFLYIALGSCAEVETQLVIARNLNFSDTQSLIEKNDRIKRMIQGLIKKRKSED
ncbi:MAG: four helix bundle protein [Thiovulaceae bacterium]|nr:four helix bundle protein [Sulfurimonadaceae bacterium]